MTRAYFQTLLIFNAIFFNNAAFATSALYQTKGNVILLNNTPCVYSENLDNEGSDETIGVSLLIGKTRETVWANHSTPVPKQRERCVLVGGGIYSFKPLEWYIINLGTRYAYVDLCLNIDETGLFFLTDILPSGKCLETRKKIEEKHWWQRLLP